MWGNLPWNEVGPVIGVLILIAGWPYFGIATGRLQPRKNVEDWRDAYFKSESARTTDRETTSKLLGYAEATEYLLRTALPHAPPPRQRETDENAP
jgi:hypothetical protein